MKEANQKRIIRIINFLIIASLIGSNIYFYNQSNSFFKETRILGNMLAMEKEKHNGIAVGKRVPEQEIKMLDGRVRSLIPSRDEQLIIVFFKTDCVPCMKELEDIQKLVKEKQISPRISLIAITAEKAETVKNFTLKHDITIPVAANANKIVDAFAINQYPFTYVINGQGFVELREAGYDRASAIANQIKNLLKSGKIE